MLSDTVQWKKFRNKLNLDLFVRFRRMELNGERKRSIDDIENGLLAAKDAINKNGRW